MLQYSKIEEKQAYYRSRSMQLIQQQPAHKKQFECQQTGITLNSNAGVDVDCTHNFGIFNSINSRIIQQAEPINNSISIHAQPPIQIRPNINCMKLFAISNNLPLHSYYGYICNSAISSNENSDSKKSHQLNKDSNSIKISHKNNVCNSFRLLSRNQNAGLKQVTLNCKPKASEQSQSQMGIKATPNSQKAIQLLTSANAAYKENCQKVGFGSGASRKPEFLQLKSNSNTNKKYKQESNNNKQTFNMHLRNIFLKTLASQKNNQSKSINQQNEIKAQTDVNFPKFISSQTNYKQAVKFKCFNRVDNKIQIGFFVGEKLARNQPLTKHNYGPGPGQYYIRQYSTSQQAQDQQRIDIQRRRILPLKSCKKDKNIRSSAIDVSHDQNYPLRSLKLSQSLQPLWKNSKENNFSAPNYLVPMNKNKNSHQFVSHKQNQKQKLKTIFAVKKNKNRQLLEKLNRYNTEKKRMHQQEGIAKQNINTLPDMPQKLNNNAQSMNRSNSFDMKPHNNQKLIRRVLMERTASYLPNVQPNWSQGMGYRGATHLHTFSNSFIAKNDHSFQAHFYRPPQRQSEYIFVRGKE